MVSMTGRVSMLSRFLVQILTLTSICAGVSIGEGGALKKRQLPIDDSRDLLLQNLLANGFNQVASTLTTSSGILDSIYASPGQKTFLAPTDTAIQSAPTWLDLPSTLPYHFLNGTVPLDDLGRLPSHTVMHSFLNDVQYANLPGGNGQAVAMSAMKRGTGQMNEALNDDTFSSDIKPFTVGDILVQPVSAVMMIPRTSLFTMAQVTNNTQAATLLQYLPFSLDKMRGVTIFAPSDAAIQRFRNVHPTLSNGDLLNTFLNHLISDRVVYSPLLILQGSLVTMAGQDMRVSAGASGALSVSVGNATANIVQTDVMHRGGVIHLIDTVLSDTQNSPSRADQAAASSLDSANSFIAGPVSANNSASSQGTSVPPSPPGSPSPQARNSTVKSVFDATEGGALALIPGAGFSSGGLSANSSSSSSSRYSNEGSRMTITLYRTLLPFLLLTIGCIPIR